MRKLAVGLIAVLCLQAAAASAQSAFGHVDTPRPGDTIHGVVAVSGWVLDINQVSSIDLYVDGAKVAAADINLPRVDVLNVFPTYANSPTALPGFITSFYTQKGAPNFVYPSGPHTVSIKVVESANPNVSIDIAEIPVTVDNSLNQSPFGYIDIPAANPATTEGFDSSHPVSGWAIDDGVCPAGSAEARCGVDHIDILVDGQIVAGAVCCNVPGTPSSGSSAGTALYGSTRPDVQATFPDVPDSLYSGWIANIDTTQLINGLHTISARVTDGQGVSRVIGSRIVQTDNASLNLHPFGQVDYPLDESTIPSVCGTSSTDCGGVSGCVPGPASVCPTTSSLNVVNGWVLDTGARLDFGQTGYVELLIDGVVIANTRRDCIQGAHGAFENCFGVNRPDVEQNYPGFVNSDNAGFVFDFWAIDDGEGHIFIEIPTGTDTCQNITVIAPGKHDVTVMAGDVSETGPTQIGLLESVDFVVCASTALDRPGFGNIDYPFNDQFIDGTVEVVGWAFDPNGFGCNSGSVSHVDIDVDGTIVGRAQWCLSRPDVPAGDARVTTSGVGFGYALDTTLLSDSPHDINVYETDNGGHRTLVGRRKVVVNNNVATHGPGL
ncbi:MAG: hypothetical protein ACRD16_00205 [Thermoanaerobaculia bacterium]